MKVVPILAHEQENASHPVVWQVYSISGSEPLHDLALLDFIDSNSIRMND